MAKIQIRRDSGSTWASVDPILAEGELGLELGSGLIKIGDGIRSWNQLPYLSTGGGGGGTSDPNALRRGDNVSELYNDANYISAGDELDDIVINGATFNGDVSFTSSIEPSGVLFDFDDASLNFKDNHIIKFGTDDTDGMIYSGTFGDLTGVHFRGTGSNTTLYRWGSTEFLSSINGNNLAKIKDIGGVELYYQGEGNLGSSLKRLETTSEGIDVTGTLKVSGGNDVGKLEIEDKGAYSQITFYNSDGSSGGNIQGVEGNLYLNASNITLGFGNTIQSDGQVDFNSTNPLTTTVNFHNGFNILGGDVSFGASDITTTGDITARNALFDLGTVTVTGYNNLSSTNQSRIELQDNEIRLNSYVYGTGGSVGTQQSRIIFNNTSGGTHALLSGYTGSSDIKFTLPNSQGNSTQVLATDGSGNTYWRSVSSDGSGGEGTGGAVESVNDQTGIVSLGIQDMNDYELQNATVEYEGNTTKTSTPALNAGEWSIGPGQDESTDDYFEYNPNQSGYMDLCVIGTELTFKANGVPDHTTTVTENPAANGNNPTIFFRVSDEWPQQWLDLPEGSSVTVTSSVFNSLDLKQPLVEGDILQWDSSIQKFRPNPIPSPTGTRQPLSNTTVSIEDNSTTSLNISGYKAYSLFAIETSHASWVRVFTTDESRTFDATRSEGNDPSPGSGVITEVRTFGAEKVQISPGVIGFNYDTTPNDTIYLSVTNRSGSSSPITVTLTAIKLED